MALVLTIEAHLLDTLPAWCPSCLALSASEHRVALVDPHTLAVVARVAGTFCSCGYEEHVRL